MNDLVLDLGKMLILKASLGYITCVSNYSTKHDVTANMIRSKVAFVMADVCYCD